MQVEALLEYFHVTCAPTVADMYWWVRVKLLSSVNVAATEAMVKCKDLKSKLNACIIDATYRFHKQIADHMAQTKMPWPKGFVPEVDGDNFEASQARAAIRMAAVAAHTPFAPQPATPWIELPWKEWLKYEAGPTARHSAGGTAAVAAVLRMLHKRGRTEDLPITIECNGKRMRVITTMDGESGELMIPPCGPKFMMMHEKSLHPRRTRITYQLMHEAVPDVTTAAPVPAVANAMFKRGVMGVDVDNAAESVFVIGEFMTPESYTTDEHAASPDGTSGWRWDGRETMHPYWAVKRLTVDQIIAARTHDDARMTRCRIKEVEFITGSNVATNTGNWFPASESYTVSIPMLTNEEKFCKGMELVIEVDAPKQALRKRNHACEDDQGGECAKQSPHTYATPATKKSRVDGA